MNVVLLAYFRGIKNLHFVRMVSSQLEYWRHTRSGLRHLETISTLKMMKSAFYLTSKALFVLKIFRFLWWNFWSCSEWNGLIRKIRLISLWCHSLVNKYTYYSISRGVKTIKFGQLMEYNMRNIFFKKVIHKMWWSNYSQTLIWKIKIEHISGSIF